MTVEEKVEEYVKEKISDMKVNGFTLLEIAHLSNGANIYNPKVEHLLNDKIRQAYFDGLAEGRKENNKLTSKLLDETKRANIIIEQLRNNLRKYEVVPEIECLPNGIEVYKENVGSNPYGVIPKNTKYYIDIFRKENSIGGKIGSLSYDGSITNNHDYFMFFDSEEDADTYVNLHPLANCLPPYKNIEYTYRVIADKNKGALMKIMHIKNNDDLLNLCGGYICYLPRNSSHGAIPKYIRGVSKKSSPLDQSKVYITFIHHNADVTTIHKEDSKEYIIAYSEYNTHNYFKSDDDSLSELIFDMEYE